MKNLSRKMYVFIISMILAGTSLAANDPSIKGDLRSNVQYSMQQFVNNQSVNGEMYLYDNIAGDVLKLKLDELHDGIVKKGDFYVSCADFTDQKGRKIDVDFLVRPNGNLLLTTQAIIHSVDGKKRKYHLENN